MTRVLVYYPIFDPSDDHAASFTDWTRGPRPLHLDFAGALELALSGPPALELAYAITNSYPDELHCGTEHLADVVAWRERGLRSMSVGDVVVVDGTAWICANSGFRALHDQDLSGIDFRDGPVTGPTH